MIQYIQNAFYRVAEASTELTQTHWMMLSAVVLIVGFFALRGFTERI